MKRETLIIDLLFVVGLGSQCAGLYLAFGTPAAATVVGTELMLVAIAGAMRMTGARGA